MTRVHRGRRRATYLAVQRDGGLDDAVARLLHPRAEALEVPAEDGAVDALEVAPAVRVRRDEGG